MTADPRLGAELGGYRIESLLGRGGMGVVYLAEHAHLGRKVALKLIAPEVSEDEVFRERFLTESRLAAAIDHPNVIPIYDAGEADGVLYLAMRFVEGEDLGALLDREGPLDTERAYQLLAPVAAALEAAHEAGLVHRDVKPGNILVAGDSVYLTDFGLTKRVEVAGGPTLTGQLLGSLGYVPPEQIEGRPLDGRADLYALACVAYEALAGAPPFEREQEVALIFAHLTETPPLLSEHRPDLAPLDEALRRAMSKHPEERQAGPVAFVEELFASEQDHTPAATAPGRRKRKLVTIVSVDLSGSDEIDPEALERLFPRVAELAGAALADEGGRVEGAGDYLTAIFGVPRAREDDALRAVRGATAAIAALGDLSDELEQRWGAGVGVRAGMETGEVIVEERVGTGPLPSATVRTAARMRECASAGEVVLGETTHRVVREWVETEETAGGGRRVTVVLEKPRQLARPETPLVGRDSERALVTHAFERAARDQSCQLVTLVGEAGVGKSRLVEDATSELGARATVLTGHCLSYGEGVTFFPLVSIVRGAAEASEAESADEIQRRLRTIMADDEDGELVVARVLQLIGLAVGTLRTEEGFWALRRLFEELARRRPLVLVLEDCHWAEPTLLELLEHVADWVRGAPILILCTARPELFDVRPGWGGGKVNVSSVLLEPLVEEASHSLVTALLGDQEAPGEVVDRISAAAEGNPLFAEAMVEVLIEDGILRAEGGRWVATIDVDAIPVPASIQAVVAARLDLLAELDKELLERASVEGQTFHRGGVQHLSKNGDSSSLGESLGVLVRRELIRPERALFAGEDAFRFRHILIRETCYGALSKEERGELHLLFADWLEELLGNRIAEFEEIAAYHLDQALRYREELGARPEDVEELASRAGDRLAAAGERSFARGDVPAGAALLGRAREVIADPARRIALELTLADALWNLGDLEAARVVLGDAARGADETGDELLGARADIQRLVLASDTDPSFDLTELRRAIERGQGVFEQAGDEFGLAQAFLAEGEVEATLCHWANATTALEQALEHAQRAGAVREAMPIVSFIANCVYWGPTPAEVGLATCEQLLAQVRGHRVAEANVTTFLAGLQALGGDLQAARALAAQSRDTFKDLGFEAGLAAATPVYGSVELAGGDPEAAEREFRSGLEIFEAAGETGTLSTLAAFLADALARQGRYDEAFEQTVVSERNTSSDDVASQIAWRTARARIAAAREDGAEARRLAEEAIALAEPTDFLGMHAGALVALATALQAERNLDGADRKLAEALALYERKGDVVSAESVRGLLAKRGGP